MEPYRHSRDHSASLWYSDKQRMDDCLRIDCPRVVFSLYYVCACDFRNCVGQNKR